MCEYCKECIEETEKVIDKTQKNNSERKKSKEAEAMKIKQMNYESVTIKNIENVIKTGYITEFECDGDNKTLVVSEDNCKKIEKAFKQIADTVYAICEEIKNKLIKTFYNFTDILNKKITKKRFIKLLQSEGIQRNTINEIIKNNKEEYTYARYLETVENLEGRSTYDR